MLFFFFVPLWLLVAVTGVVLLFLPKHRRLGWYAITVSTTATLTSFSLSTAVLYFGVKFGAHSRVRWFGIALIGTYLFAILAGIPLGGIAGAFLTRKILSGRKRVTAPKSTSPFIELTGRVRSSTTSRVTKLIKTCFGRRSHRLVGPLLPRSRHSVTTTMGRGIRRGTRNGKRLRPLVRR